MLSEMKSKHLQKLKEFRASSLCRLLEYYASWKHPFFLFDNAKDKQCSKELYHKEKKYIHELNTKIKERSANV